ncbi:hypothetical protein KPL71_011255 [Citrus sinensis]|uniref:Uncharacterized protein n=1 Tax=Citrus sinensis TaxID=2711 RepID=A0ACB8L251_CITSI|nr:hypothetical protein KPL71_011255 [Citrus sinensis]
MLCFSGGHGGISLAIQSSNRDIIKGVAFLHECGHFHGNLTPSNVLLKRGPRRWHAKIELNLTSSQGSERWRSVEILTGTNRSPTRSYSFSLGLILFFLFSGGHHAYFGKSSNAIENEIRANRSARYHLLSGDLKKGYTQVVYSLLTERTTPADSQNFPLFWSPEKSIQFLIKVVDTLNEEPGFNRGFADSVLTCLDWWSKMRTDMKNFFKDTEYYPDDSAKEKPGYRGMDDYGRHVVVKTIKKKDILDGRLEYLKDIRSDFVARELSLDYTNIALDIIKGVAFLHKCGHFHGNLTPSNVLLKRGLRRWHAKIELNLTSSQGSERWRSVEILTVYAHISRTTPADSQNFPLFWSPEKSIQFLIEVVDTLNEEPGFNRGFADSVLTCLDWWSKMGTDMKNFFKDTEYYPGEGQPVTSYDLLRFVRNTTTHYRSSQDRCPNFRLQRRIFPTKEVARRLFPS